MIEIRKTLPTELEVLMDIFEQAKRIMRKDGNMHQWTGNYPSRELVMADIEQGNSYVCTTIPEKSSGLRLYPWKRPYICTYPRRRMAGKHTALRSHPPAGKHRAQQRSGQCLPAMVLRTNPQPTCRYPPGQPHPAIHTEETWFPVLRHHFSGQWGRTAGIPENRTIAYANFTFKSSTPIPVK